MHESLKLFGTNNKQKVGRFLIYERGLLLIILTLLLSQWNLVLFMSFGLALGMICSTWFNQYRRVETFVDHSVFNESEKNKVYYIYMTKTIKTDNLEN